MQSVGAAWLMTSLTSSPVYIALIQTASALPFFLLALPAGSIGDIVDRRRLILGTEIWMFAIAAVLTVVTFAGTMTPWLRARPVVHRLGGQCRRGGDRVREEDVDDPASTHHGPT